MAETWLLKNWASLYSNQTDFEKLMEPEIASLGVRYRTQHPVWSLGVFPDFVLLDYKVVIEVDDKSHRGKAKKKADEERTAKLVKLGWRVTRCTNEAVKENPREALRGCLAEVNLDHLLIG